MRPVISKISMMVKGCKSEMIKSGQLSPNNRLKQPLSPIKLTTFSKNNGAYTPANVTGFKLKIQETASTVASPASRHLPRIKEEEPEHLNSKKK